MPILLRYNQMSSAQQTHRHVQARYGRMLLNPGEMSVADLDWRLCVWFCQDGSRPVYNRRAVVLSERTPLDILYVLRRDMDKYRNGNGISILDRAHQVLLTDLLDAKAPLLVLCDWLEEHQFPDAVLLRAFCVLPLCWSVLCLPTASRPAVPSVVTPAG